MTPRCTILPVTQIWKLEIFSNILTKEASPRKFFLKTFWKYSQVTIGNTDARLLGAQHVTVGSYCFLQAVVKKCAVETWGYFSLQSVYHLNGF